MAHEFKANNNGDSMDTLKAEFLKVMGIAVALEESLKAVTVHGRNYQFAEGDAAFARDRDALRAQIEAVRAVGTWAEQGALRTMSERSGRR